MRILFYYRVSIHNEHTRIVFCLSHMC
jgi:hypothetical protein